MSPEVITAERPTKAPEPTRGTRLITHGLLVLLLIGMLAVIPASVLYRQGERVSMGLMAPVVESYVTFDDDGRPSGPPPKELVFSDSIGDRSPEDEARLQEQLDVIRVRISVYLSIMMRFYSWHYTSITLAAIAGLVAAVALLFISKSGWVNASTYVVTVFVTASAIAGLYTAIPRLYQQRASIAECKSLFLSHVALESRVLSYVATGLTAAGEHSDIKIFIRATDKEMATLHRWPIEIDPSAAPAPGEILKEAASSAQ